jgi:hypothetical protein
MGVRSLYNKLMRELIPFELAVMNHQCIDEIPLEEDD